MGECDYHLHRARAERSLAEAAADGRVFIAHLRLSALHLERALALRDVARNLAFEAVPEAPEPRLPAPLTGSELALAPAG